MVPATGIARKVRYSDYPPVQLKQFITYIRAFIKDYRERFGDDDCGGDIPKLKAVLEHISQAIMQDGGIA